MQGYFSTFLHLANVEANTVRRLGDHATNVVTYSDTLMHLLFVVVFLKSVKCSSKLHSYCRTVGADNGRPSSASKKL